MCICTYQREELLKTLLKDLAQQSILPGFIVIVDGAPGTGRVCHALSESTAFGLCPPHYIPSNHGNLAYQRYLGWRIARAHNAKFLLYLDDDLRIPEPYSISRLLEPLQNSSVVGCTGPILYPEDRESNADPAGQDRARFNKRKAPLLVLLFGTSRRMAPGSLTPTGQRCPPEPPESATHDIYWLRGGVMACRMDALTEDSFSESLFSLSELGYGHGEDTLFSLRLASKGRLRYVPGARFLHPCADRPKAYATHARKMGYGVAYSRRLINDNYRWPESPTFSDRFDLLKSYTGTALLCIMRAIRNPSPHRFVYAGGYMIGAFKGVFMPPTQKRLTPLIDWQKDAEAALNAQLQFGLES